MTDPFTIVHRAIWAALAANQSWSALVKPGNRIDMTARTFQQLRTANLSPADVPEVMLVQGAFGIKPFGSNSKCAQFSQVYRLMVTTDTLNVVPINQVKFLTAVALLKAGPDLGAVDDGGNPIVESFEITEARDSDDDKSLSRGSRRWVCVLAIRVQMYMAKQDLLALP